MGLLLIGKITCLVNQKPLNKGSHVPDIILTAMHCSPGLLHCQLHGSPQKVRAISSDTPQRLTTGDWTGSSYSRCGMLPQ